MTTKRENIACRPGTTDAMQRLADENEALRVERDGLAARVERMRSVIAFSLSVAEKIQDAHDEGNCEIGMSFYASLTRIENDSHALLYEAPTQSLAHLKAEGAREALQRAMQTPGFSDTVVMVADLEAVIEQMEVGE